MADPSIQIPTQDLFQQRAQNVIARGTQATNGEGTLDVAKARKVAEEFESVFLAEVLKPMFEGIKAEEPFGGGYAEDLWRSMQVAEYGKALAKNGGFGIGDAVFRQLLRTQEVK